MRSYSILLLMLAGCLPMAASPALAQHATAFDIVDGKQAFQNYCANCHGPDGNLVANVDLGHGSFRRPYSDDDLARIIMNGIADTPMPPTPNMSEQQALKVVAYLRSLATSGNDDLMGGDAGRGGMLFDGKGNCRSCHRVDGRGSGLGPDLSAIGRLRTTAELVSSLLDPENEVQPNNRFYTVRTKSGRRYTGRLLNHDAFSVQMLDTDEKLHSFMKTDLQEYGFTPSQMPSLRGDFDEQEIADLVAFLVSLRGPTQ